MPRKPKIVKDSDNFALKEARRWAKDRGIGVGYSRAEMERIFEGILSLRAQVVELEQWKEDRTDPFGSW